jgi:hypothetical protein
MALKKGTKPMVQRRDILKTSLTLCGCAASGALATGALGAEARADGPTTVSGTGYRLSLPRSSRASRSTHFY